MYVFIMIGKYRRRPNLSEHLKPATGRTLLLLSESISFQLSSECVVQREAHNVRPLITKLCCPTDVSCSVISLDVMYIQ